MLRDRIAEAFKVAMKRRDGVVVGCIRMVMAAVKNLEIEKGEKLDDGEYARVLSKLAKQRSESIEMYRAGNRIELAEKEEAELLFIKKFLPKQISDDELAKLVDEAIAESGASSPKDMGKIMKNLMSKLGGQADGRRVSDLVLKKLS